MEHASSELQTRLFARYADLHETHTGVVTLVGSRAYKFKKPCRTAFLDFSTVELREEACDRELQLNRRLAPDVYLGVGHLSDPTGGPDEPILVMRRMPETARLSTMIRSGIDLENAIVAVAQLMATFHLSANRSEDIDLQGTARAVLARWDNNFREMAAFCEQAFVLDVLQKIEGLALQYLRGRECLFDQRIAERRIVDGHGDLIADDVFCLPDGPRALDCLDFDDGLRFIDSIDDIAFLAMDLEYLGRSDLARTFLDEYTRIAGDPSPRSLIHHYIAYRAMVRAKVDYICAEQGNAESLADAGRHLKLCLDHLELSAVRLCLVGGLPGTGKSTIATSLANHGGAELISSDRIRRELQASGQIEGPAGRFRSGLYAPEISSLVYATMLDRAETYLAQGRSVVLDASWIDARERNNAALLAVAANAVRIDMCCVAPSAVAAARIECRRATDSDATPAIAAEMAVSADWPNAVVVDTSVSLEESVTASVKVWNEACA